MCWFIAYKDIHVSSLLTLVFECVSVACILALAFVVLFKHGLTIDTTIVKAKGMTFHGLSLAVVICIFSLVGFESATTLGGEAKNPLRNVPRAVVVSLIITGAFMVFMSYVEVFGTRHYGTPLNEIALPLTTLSKIYGVTFFKIPVALGAMVSFFSLTLSCLNAGSRIIYPMARAHHLPQAPGPGPQGEPDPARGHHRVHPGDRHHPGGAGDLHQPAHHLRRRRDPGRLRLPDRVLPHLGGRPRLPEEAGSCRPHHLVVAAMACLLLMVPLIGSFVPVPPFPVDIFPYIFLAYMLAGSGLALHHQPSPTRGPA